MKDLVIVCDKCGEKATIDINRGKNCNILKGWFLSPIEDVCPSCVAHASRTGKFYNVNLFVPTIDVLNSVFNF